MFILVSIGMAQEFPWEKGTTPLLPDSLLLKEVNLKSEKGSSSPKVSSKKQVVSTTTAPKVFYLRGVVITSSDKSPLEGVSITILKNSKIVYTSTSNQSGLFLFNPIPRGIYQLELQKKGYLVRRTSFEIPIEDGLQEYILKRPIKTLAAIKVKKTRKRGSLADALQKRKVTDGVVDGVSAEQIAKSTDSDAGAIAKRVTGASVVGGKYVFVRGLGERYTNMTLNGLPVPSPETDKRVVPQDLFSASSLESFFIYKTFTPNLPSDFAGGSLVLVTKGIPSKNFWKVSANVGGVDYVSDGSFLTWGQDRLSYDRGTGWQTWFGYDDGTRERPNVPKRIDRIDFLDTRRDLSELDIRKLDSLCPTCEIEFGPDGTTPGLNGLAAIASQFNNKWAVDTAKVLPSLSYGISLGRNWKVGEEGEAGLLWDLSYKSRFQWSERNAIKFAPRFVESSNQYRVQEVVYTKTLEGKEKYTLSGFLNLGYTNRSHELWWKNLYASIADDKTSKIIATGLPSQISQDDPWEERFVLEYLQRDLVVSQIGGEHYIGTSVFDSLSWAVGYAKTSAQSPDRRRYYFSRRLSPSEPTDTVVNEESFRIGNVYITPSGGLDYETIRAPNGTRTWEELEETGLSGRMDWHLIVPPSIQLSEFLVKKSRFYIKLPKAQTGMLFATKDRKFEATRYSWRQILDDGLITSNASAGDYNLVSRIHHPDTVKNYVLQTGGIGFNGSPLNYGQYTAKERVMAGYWNMQWEYKLLIPSKLYGGGRIESYSFEFNAPYTGRASGEDQVIQKNDLQIYASLGLQHAWSSSIKTNLSYSNNVIRPEIRERIPTRFYDSEKDVFVTGEPRLKDTRVRNWDLRLDYFLPLNQLFSFSIFHKFFKDPVEVINDTEASPNTNRFQNSQEAFVRGMEVEGLLRPFAWVGLAGHKWWKGWEVYGNFALMQSEVQLDTTSRGTNDLLSFTRPLTGQSEYLINLKISYDVTLGKTEWTNALLYNEFGDRVAEVGSDNIDAFYEAPFKGLDYLLKMKLGQLDLKLQIKNLFNSERVTYVTGLDSEIVGTDREGNPVTQLVNKRKEVSRSAVGVSYSLGASWSW